MNARGAFLFCTGSDDPLCTPDQLLTFTGALQDAGIDWRVNIYGGPSTLSGPPRGNLTAH